VDFGEQAGHLWILLQRLAPRVNGKSKRRCLQGEAHVRPPGCQLILARLAMIREPYERACRHGPCAKHVEALPESPMKTRAAVAFEAKKPLEIVELDLEGPKAGEVLVEIKATGICHTDAYTLSGSTPKASSPPSSAMKARASCAKSARASPA
jgi:hypothetical protein